MGTQGTLKDDNEKKREERGRSHMSRPIPRSRGERAYIGGLKNPSRAGEKRDYGPVSREELNREGKTMGHASRKNFSMTVRIRTKKGRKGAKGP